MTIASINEIHSYGGFVTIDARRFHHHQTHLQVIYIAMI